MCNDRIIIEIYFFSHKFLNTKFILEIKYTGSNREGSIEQAFSASVLLLFQIRLSLL